MSGIEYPLHGSCQCGGVQLTLKRAPLKILACHCRECQKLSTSAFSITALVEEEALEISGELADWERSSASGNINAAKFCPGCGNRIYHYNPATPGLLKLKPTYFDDTRFIQPTVHLWVSEKQDWLEIPEGVDVFEQQGGI